MKVKLEKQIMHDGKIPCRIYYDEMGGRGLSMCNGEGRTCNAFTDCFVLFFLFQKEQNG